MRPNPPVRLTPAYRNFCAFETVAINGIGCGTLVFQDQLSATCPYPGLYEFWLAPPAPATETEQLLCLMMAAWIGVAGTVQCAVNFDPRVPRFTKLVALYTFALCDIAWVVLMVQHLACFSPYHVVGSAITIVQRARFWRPNGERLFLDDVNESPSQE